MEVLSDAHGSLLGGGLSSRSSCQDLLFEIGNRHEKGKEEDGRNVRMVDEQQVRDLGRVQELKKIN